MEQVVVATVVKHLVAFMNVRRRRLLQHVHSSRRLSHIFHFTYVFPPPNYPLASIKRHTSLRVPLVLANQRHLLFSVKRISSASLLLLSNPSKFHSRHGRAIRVGSCDEQQFEPLAPACRSLASSQFSRSQAPGLQHQTALQVHVCLIVLFDWSIQILKVLIMLSFMKDPRRAQSREFSFARSQAA